MGVGRHGGVPRPGGRRVGVGGRVPGALRRGHALVVRGSVVPRLSGLSRAGAEAGGACGGAASGRPTPPNNALERTGHSVRFVARGSQYIVARRSPPALDG
jgi:hypothetical protein